MKENVLLHVHSEDMVTEKKMHVPHVTNLVNLVLVEKKIVVIPVNMELIYINICVLSHVQMDIMKMIMIILVPHVTILV